VSEPLRGYARAVDQLRRSCIIALIALAVVCAGVAWRSAEWRLAIVVLPVAEAMVLLWYFDARLRVFAAEVGDTIEREVEERVREQNELQRARERGI
jgi:hypothetical protein